jgi:hypothetical protein
MSALKDAVQGFKTGDLVITYLPRRGGLLESIAGV